MRASAGEVAAAQQRLDVANVNADSSAGARWAAIQRHGSRTGRGAANRRTGELGRS